MAESCSPMQPTPEHHRILSTVGAWKVACKFYMQPGQPPLETEATDTVEALGPFWTLSRFEGSMMGQPFSGVTTLGYEPAQQRFVSTWVDTMMPHLWYFTGGFIEDGKVLELKGQAPSMGGEGTAPWRITHTFESPDTMTLRMFTTLPDGPEVMTMENTYTRMA